MRIAIVLLASLPLLAVSADHHVVAGNELEAVQWLAGCWRASLSEAGSGEQWTSSAGGAMLGVSRTIRNGRMTAFEFMRIDRVQSGKYALLAQPDGLPATTFALLKLSATEIIFENLQHDFPQRVSYRLKSPQLLLASIEGESKGVKRRVEQPMTRERCDSSITSGR